MVALPSEQFYLTTKLSNVGESINFGHELRQDSLPSVVNIFVTKNLPSTDYGLFFLHQNSILVRTQFSYSLRASAVSLTVSQLRGQYGSVRRPSFRPQQPGTLLCITQSPTFSASCATGIPVIQVLWVTLFCVSCFRSFPFKFLLHKYKSILTPL